jgi:uncharacterized protein
MTAPAVVTTEPYLLDLGGRLGATTAAGVAFGTWAVTVVAAAALGRAGRRGPLEVLLRRLSYGRSPDTGPRSSL